MIKAGKLAGKGAGGALELGSRLPFRHAVAAAGTAVLLRWHRGSGRIGALEDVAMPTTMVQVKVAIDKQQHPERYCPVSRCLWVVTQWSGNGDERVVRENCPGGYCPRHQHLRKGQ